MPIITGKELAEKILQQITEDPESHNQDIWATTSGYSECGTVACIAGWAVEFNRNEGEGKYRALERLGAELNADPWYDSVGRELLGLGSAAADLFYIPGNRPARRKLAELFGLPDPE